MKVKVNYEQQKETVAVAPLKGSAEDYRKVIYDWVKLNFGESEAEDPSWNIEALAHELARHYVAMPRLWGKQ